LLKYVFLRIFPNYGIVSNLSVYRLINLKFSDGDFCLNYVTGKSDARNSHKTRMSFFWGFGGFVPPPFTRKFFNLLGFLRKKPLTNFKFFHTKNFKILFLLEKLLTTPLSYGMGQKAFYILNLFLFFFQIIFLTLILKIFELFLFIYCWEKCVLVIHEWPHFYNTCLNFYILIIFILQNNASLLKPFMFTNLLFIVHSGIETFFFSHSGFWIFFNIICMAFDIYFIVCAYSLYVTIENSKNAQNTNRNIQI